MTNDEAPGINDLSLMKVRLQASMKGHWCLESYFHQKFLVFWIPYPIQFLKIVTFPSNCTSCDIYSLIVYQNYLEILVVLTQGFPLMRSLAAPVILKLVSAIIYRIPIFHQMIALQKLWKMFFISSKKLFFVFLPSPFFPPVNHSLRGRSKKNLKISDVIHCLNKNLIAHFV